MRVFILFLFVLLFGCSRMLTPLQQRIENANAKNENKGAVPFAETIPPENTKVVVDANIPYHASHVKIAGHFEKRGNFDLIETGLLYSQMHSNLVLGNTDVFRKQGTPHEGYLTCVIDMFAGADLYVRAYAVNRHGVGYGNVVKFVLCQRPVGLQGYGLFYAAIDVNGVRHLFPKNRKAVQAVAETWYNANTPFIELKGLTIYAPYIAPGAPVYVNDTNGCDTLFDGYYLIDKVPFQTIYIQEGRITEVVEGNL